MILDETNKLTRKGAKAFDSDLVKTVRLAGLTISVTGGVGGLLYTLVLIGLRIFGVF